jgi:uncharacterized membrane protein YebE (DUF533 family)
LLLGNGREYLARAMEETKLGRDVFLALAAVGWADGHLDPDEADAIVRTALDEGLEIEEISEIEKATQEPVDIGSIDISKLSKADRLFVYAVGTWIARVDGHLARDEREALDRLGAVLKIPDRPRQHADQIAEQIGKLGDGDKPAFFNLPKLRNTLKVRLAEAQKLRAAKGAVTKDEADED